MAQARPGGDAAPVGAAETSETSTTKLSEGEQQQQQHSAAQRGAAAKRAAWSVTPPSAKVPSILPVAVSVIRSVSHAKRSMWRTSRCTS